MTPQMMVLGLVVEESGTVSDTQRRLTDLFPLAGFARNAAHTNLPRLAERGYVRLVEKGAEASQDCYAATEEGIGQLREWISHPPPPPAIREAVHGKFEFGGLEDLEMLLRMVRVEERACRAESDDAHGRMLSEQRTRLRLPSRDWRAELDMGLSMIHLKDVALTLNDRANRRREVGDELEELIGRFRGMAG